MSWKGSSALVWDAERLRIATDAAGVALWSWNVDSDLIAMDDHAHKLWGVPRAEPLNFEALSARIHPKDLARVREAFEATRAVLGAYDIDFRIVRDGETRWISARGQGNDAGIIGRLLFGVFLDVTDRKQIEETREILAGEMSHRVKNLLAIASALTAIAARSATSTAGMARDLIQRLSALGQAHDLVRPVPEQAGDPGARLEDLFTILLAPYAERSLAGNRIQVCLPELRVGEATATTLALVVHELATNSIKYGALSQPAGTLRVTCHSEGGEVIVVWTERGGPRIVKSKGLDGFGTKLVARSVSGQLGGPITYDWQPEGLVVTLRMHKERLTK